MSDCKAKMHQIRFPLALSPRPTGGLNLLHEADDVAAIMAGIYSDCSTREIHGYSSVASEASSGENTPTTMPASADAATELMRM